jgi:hypothetical protein
VWEEGEDPSPEPVPLTPSPIPVPPSSRRDSGGMEATWGRAASPHSGHGAPGYGHQQSEHAAF